MYGIFGRRLAARTLPPVTIRGLRLALQDEWAAMPQQLIDTLILSMGRRCETCLTAFIKIIETEKQIRMVSTYLYSGSDSINAQPRTIMQPVTDVTKLVVQTATEMQRCKYTWYVQRATDMAKLVVQTTSKVHHCKYTWCVGSNCCD
ncbi:hypothetical protein TNCV_4515221 [Trichonephila clavipes]|nr:hypothetical protein TNCV_4515221 [Trichonephila clavipes]